MAEGGSLVPLGARLLLIYDGYCGICTRTVEWVRSRDLAGRIAALPNQTPGLAARTGFSRADVDRAAWAIDRAGRRFAGAAAINRSLYELPGWRFIARLYRLPGIRQIQDLGYRIFAGNRGRFARWGVVPTCEREGAACLPEGAAD